jgi:hypothetical protein
MSENYGMSGFTERQSGRILGLGSEAGRGAANALGGEKIGRRISQVDQAQAEMQESLSMLHEALNALEDRLQPVLTPINTSTAGRDNDPVPMAPTVASRIGQHAGGTRAAATRIHALMERLEV